MGRRGLSLVLALLVAGAPVALQACQLVCAGAATRTAAGDAHRVAACHDAATPNGPRMTTRPHACGHDGDLPHASGITAPEGVRTAAAADLPLTPDLVATLFVDAGGPPPGGADPPRHARPRSSTPLRI